MFSGIVAAIGRISKIDKREGGVRLGVSASRLGMDDVAIGDSIAVNGVSLTVNAVNGSKFEINLIPHTLQATNLNGLTVGSKVNLEIDLLARYVERHLTASK